MGRLREFFSHRGKKDDNEKDGRAKIRSDSPSQSRLNSQTPKSPISPISPLCRTEGNNEYLNQCLGCSNIAIFIRKNINRKANGAARIETNVLHDSFAELEYCSQNCDICRVFRQAFLLQEVTFDGVKCLRQTTGEVVVRWQEENSKPYVRIEINGSPEFNGIVNFHAKNDVAHLELSSTGLDSVVIEQAKEWIETCINTHVGKCDNLKWSTEKPPYLVEILSANMIRLSEDSDGEYVALSYCWGNYPAMSDTEKKMVDDGQTLTTNLKKRCEQPFSVSEVATTVQDAIKMIHALGIRYAWIDALCITQDNPVGVGGMHKVYSNALFTLCSCTTTAATAKMLDHREAWSRRTEPCQLGGQWLTTPDMSLNELRLRSPLADRAWTLQEERLSPRMLYISSSRVYWSCAVTNEMEMKPIYGHKNTSPNRPVYAATDRDKLMPVAQDFLLACYSDSSDLHIYWAEIIKSFVARDMSVVTDRFRAVSGIAARYLSASAGDEYIAGLWAKTLAEDLAWRVLEPIGPPSNKKKDPLTVCPTWPSWSWVVLPLLTHIETNAESTKSPYFQLVKDARNGTSQPKKIAEDAIKNGEQVTEIQVKSRLRRFWTSISRRGDWSSISRIIDNEEVYTFSNNPGEALHAIDFASGRLLVREDRKKEVIAQLDYRRDVEAAGLDKLELWALELGESCLLLLKQDLNRNWRRAGVAWNVRKGFFDSAELQNVVLR